jgi:SM-20-related protein
LIGEPGLLVAFRSDVLHEVEAVTHGERYSIVSWFS